MGPALTVTWVRFLWEGPSLRPTAAHALVGGSPVCRAAKARKPRWHPCPAPPLGDQCWTCRRVLRAMGRAESATPAGPPRKEGPERA